MSSKKIAKLCNELPYSNSDTLNDDIFELTINALRSLCSEYDYVDVLGELSGIRLIEPMLLDAMKKDMIMYYNPILITLWERKYLNIFAR